jgi:hypothetical protein
MRQWLFDARHFFQRGFAKSSVRESEDEEAKPG